jgi:dihydrofolate reductase
MAILRLGMTVSVDGFVADAFGSSDILYADSNQLRSSDFLQDLIGRVGAVVMGRNAYEMAKGDLTGYEFQVPIFVLTTDPPENPPKGQNDRLKVSFVTDGVEKAVAMAKESAGDKLVVSMGGANTAAQLLDHGLVDELELTVVPLMLKEGLRYFEHLDTARNIKLEKVSVTETGPRTVMLFKVAR